MNREGAISTSTIPRTREHETRCGREITLGRENSASEVNTFRSRGWCTTYLALCRSVRRSRRPSPSPPTRCSSFCGYVSGTSFIIRILCKSVPVSHSIPHVRGIEPRLRSRPRLCTYCVRINGHIDTGAWSSHRERACSAPHRRPTLPFFFLFLSPFFSPLFFFFFFLSIIRHLARRVSSRYG